MSDKAKIRGLSSLTSTWYEPPFSARCKIADRVAQTPATPVLMGHQHLERLIVNEDLPVVGIREYRSDRLIQAHGTTELH